MDAKACSPPTTWRPSRHNETRRRIDAQELHLRELLLFLLCETLQRSSYLSKKPASFVLYKTFFCLLDQNNLLLRYTQNDREREQTHDK